MRQTLNISLLQTDIAWNAPEDSIQRCAPLVEDALTAGGELLVFPEMFTCGFSLPTGELAHRAASVGLSFLTTIARQHQVYTIGTLPEVDSDGTLFNTAWLCAPDGTTVAYRKIHLFSYGDEASVYSAGADAISVSIKGLRCTPFICYDLRFGAPFAKLATGTDLFVVMANWPASRREHWTTLLRARAIENQAYVAGVNRVGSGGGLDYSGDSMLFAPDGRELANLGDKPIAITVQIDTDSVRQWRDTFPALKDRKPDVYERI